MLSYYDHLLHFNAQKLFFLFFPCYFLYVKRICFFDQNPARSTVPGGPSIACSTAKAVEWDAAWSKNLDPSGRAALGVHEAAYEEAVEAKNVTVMNGPQQKIQGTVEKTATVA